MPTRAASTRVDASPTPREIVGSVWACSLLDVGQGSTMNSSKHWLLATTELCTTYGVAPEALALHLEHLASRGATPNLAHAEDLVLAFAASSGNARAVQRLRDSHGAMMRGVALSIRRDESFADEVVQDTWCRLLCDGRASKLLTYGARGPLGGWLRTFTAREAVRASRRSASSPGDEIVLDRIAAEEPSQSGIAARHYEAPLREAVALAFADLEPADRNLLRYAYLYGLKGEQMAALAGVHRVTLSRRLSAVRERVLVAASRHLARRLDVPTREAESLLVRLYDRVDVSLRATLSNVRMEKRA